MASKGKNNNQVQGRDSFCRMNFLFQASMLMAGKNDTLSSYYGNLCRTIGKKSVLRLEPNLKRKLCKKCGIALKPGVTAEVSATEGKREVFRMKCYKCTFEKNYVVDPKYAFWLENPNAFVKDASEKKNKMKKDSRNVTDTKQTVPELTETKSEAMDICNSDPPKAD